ncbi:hypothetical protein [Micromonospora sp. WMMD712]|uniref:hypothetical protein n=1 Tax=Micromonospora sp. WMMD712 TaxID=3016096 RepID=UPI00249AF27F|nr:hypothetical protein [Micromonospora sp. WMMD712]WFE58614.1 hypothetical protein O7633_17950 [Micromonospora sp. WMMD712]
MTYRGHKRWRARGVARGRLHVVRRALLTLLLIGAALGVSALLDAPSTAAFGATQTRAEVPKDALMISFGAGRTPLTRTMTVRPPVEGNAVRPPGAFLVRLESDLTDPGTGRQFPAQQVTVAASEITSGVLALAVSADPWSPEQVPSGDYRGLIRVSKDDVQMDVPIVLRVDERGGWSALYAVLILVAGAAAGLLIKWITERLTPQAMIYRRLALLRRAVGWGSDGRNLPVVARLQMEELQDVIARHDYGRAEQLFTDLEKEREQLASMANRFIVLDNMLFAQSEAVSAHPKPISRNVLARVDAVVDECHRRLQLAKDAPWPDRADEIARNLDVLQLNFITASQVITSYIELPNEATLRSAVDMLQRGAYDSAAQEYDRFLQSGTVETSTTAEPGKSRRSRRIRAPRAEEPGLAPWFRAARPIAGMASVLVVALVGLKLQYLGNQSFQGDLTAWLTLGLWGFVVELSGTSVMEVVARLSAGHGSGTQPLSVNRR